MGIKDGSKDVDKDPKIVLIKLGVILTNLDSLSKECKNLDSKLPNNSDDEIMEENRNFEEICEAINKGIGFHNTEILAFKSKVEQSRPKTGIYRYNYSGNKTVIAQCDEVDSKYATLWGNTQALINKAYNGIDRDIKRMASKKKI